MVDEAARRPQFGLGDLAVVVVGSAFVLDVTRRSRAAWPPGAWPVPRYAPGLVALTLVVAIGLVVALGGARRLRARDLGAWGMAWRVAALGWLGWAGHELAAALPIRPEGIDQPFERDLAHARLSLLPLVVCFGLIGLMLLLGPIRPMVRASGRRPWLGSWPSVALAGVAGLAFLTANGLIPFLVLLALEAVWNAMRRAPLVARPMLVDRLTRAGLETIPALLGCLATASWVIDDLKAATRDPRSARAPWSRWGVATRLATVSLAVGGSAYVWFDSLPRLEPNMAEGWRHMVGSTEGAMVALGFTMLAAGLAARPAARLAIGPAPEEDAPIRPFGPWVRRAVHASGCVVAAAVIASAVKSIQGGIEDRWYMPATLYEWSRVFMAPLDWFGLPGTAGGWAEFLERPGAVLFPVAAAWLAIGLVARLAGVGAGSPSAMDAIAGDRVARGRFVGWWLGLTVAVLACMAPMALAALALTHQAVWWLPR